MESLTLFEFRVNLGWNKSRLAQEAGVTWPAIDNAENGKIITAETAKAIADALSRGYGYEIKVTDIKGLNVR